MIPAYIRIHDALKKKIDDGGGELSQRLPRERDLADDYEVSRMTLRQAITLLVEEGILERRVGSGTYVASHRVQEKMRGTTSFTEIVRSQGKTPSSQVVSYQRKPANETEIQQLQLKTSDYVVRMERVRYADNMPLGFEVASIPEKVIREFKREDITEHFFQTLTDNGYDIGISQQTIYAKNASQSLATYLKVPKNHAVLALTQVSYFIDGRPFEYVHSQYVGDRFEFYFENN